MKQLVDDLILNKTLKFSLYMSVVLKWNVGEPSGGGACQQCHDEVTSDSL